MYLWLREGLPEGIRYQGNYQKALPQAPCRTFLGRTCPKPVELNPLGWHSCPGALGI